MRVLWITSAPLGRAAELIENRPSQSGTWIDNMLDAIVQVESLELKIVCIASKNIEMVDTRTGVRMQGIADVQRQIGAMSTPDEITAWNKVIEGFSPDIIMVWGTECSTGDAVLKASKNIPVLFYIQGVVGQIVNYPNGLLDKKEFFKKTGIFGRLKFLHFKRVQKRFLRQAKIESNMLQQAQGILVDNDWAKFYYQAQRKDIPVYRIPLPINRLFVDAPLREAKNVEQYTLFSIDGCNSAKGIFHLIKALKIVKEKYPNVKLRIPGRVATGNPKWLKESPYYTYLQKLIKEYDLQDNVCFLGQLTQVEMLREMEKSAVFVMPSSIENHSASLREAMHLGMPCVAALVGSVNEFTVYGVNALTYRYEDEYALAGCILKLFDDPVFAEKMGKKAREMIAEFYSQENIGNKLMNAYIEAMNRGK